MKKRLITGILIIIIAISNMMVNSNAATGTVTVTANKTELKQGDSFNIIISGNCEEGINGLDAVVSYDETKLELIESKVADSKWIDLGQNTVAGKGITIMCNTSETIKNANLYQLTFKVKESATAGTNIKITVSGITLHSDSLQTYTEGNKEVTISIKQTATEIPTNSDTTKTDTTKTDTTKTDTTKTDTTKTDTTKTDTTKTDTTKTDTTKTDTTKTNKEKLPKTGENDLIIFLGIGTIIVGAISFVGYRKYKNI